MAVSLATGRSTTHRGHFAQLGGVGVIFNGHDANKILDLRTFNLRDLGFAAPGVPASAADQGAGNVNGTVSYRCRWADAKTGTVSLAGTALSHTTASQTVRVTYPGSAPSRATHWILERTTDGGATYYPVNTSSSSPYGTLIATTTYDDSVTDSTLRQGIAYHNNQGAPRRYRWCFTHGKVIFAGGGRIHQFQCTTTSADPNITSGSGFNSGMIGQDFQVDGDVDGVSYEVLSVGGATALVLTTNYGGITESLRTARISGPRDLVGFCEPDEGEAWGSQEVTGLSNEEAIGDDGEAVIGGIGMGAVGALIAKERRMYVWRYRKHPALRPLGDGEIVALQARRGLCSPNAVKEAEGFIYGVDVYGIWRMLPGGEPEPISTPIETDFRALNLEARDAWHIGYDALFRQLFFFVCEAGDTYPKLAYVWDLARGAWIGTLDFPNGVTASLELPDANGAMRCLIYTQANGSAKSYAWFLNIGTTLGAPPVSGLSGTATSGSSTNITNSGAALPTTGEGLGGVPVTLVRASGGSEETQTIVSNTATAMTTTAFTGTAPTAGDAYHIGALQASWKTPRLDCGAPDRKKKFKRLILKLAHDTAAVDLKVRAYHDGSATATNYDNTRSAEDGVSNAAGSPNATIDPGATNAQSGDVHRFVVDLPGHKWFNDIQLEFHSLSPGDAWKILDVALEYDLEERPAGRAKD